MQPHNFRLPIVRHILDVAPLHTSVTSQNTVNIHTRTPTDTPLKATHFPIQELNGILVLMSAQLVVLQLEVAITTQERQS